MNWKLQVQGVPPKIKYSKKSLYNHNFLPIHAHGKLLCNDVMLPHNTSAVFIL